LNAIILAGGTEEDKLAQKHGVRNKAFLPINDLPMIAYVVDALLRCPYIDEIIVVGPVEDLAVSLPQGQIRFLPEQGDPIDNVLAATKLLPQDEKILVCTSDIPMITPEALSSLFVAVAEREADIYYPIIRQDDCEERYPGVKRTYAKLKDGSFTGGNVFIFNPQKVLHLAKVFKKLVEERKRPVRMCLAFGLPGLMFIFRFALGLLTVSELERRISHILNITGAAIYCSYPEVGTDVDKDSDLDLARRVLAAGS